MVGHRSGRRPVHRRAALAGLVCVLVAALVAAGWPLGVSGVSAAALITLNPNRGPCETRPVLRGMGFPPGATVSITSERTRAPGEKVSPPQSVTAAADGTFSLTLLAIHGDCGASWLPDGTEYTFTATARGPDGRDLVARDVYTYDRSVPANIRCYPETDEDHCVQGLFRGYWLSHGLDLGDPGISERESLALFGYPISDELQQRLEDGKTYRVQYFERARMEHHPENPPPYDVLLGQFGRTVLAAVRGAPTAPVAPQPGMTHFAVTGHNVGPRFMAYWRANGGLEQFGYPLTEPFDQRLEDGKTYTVQYFERARFELHPENPAPNDLHLGQFGRRMLVENTWLDGEPNFKFSFVTDEGFQVALGQPRGPVAREPAAYQAFERGAMLWQGDSRLIYVLCGNAPASGDRVRTFADPWDPTQPLGGGPGPRPGLYEPRRGFGKLWRENPEVRDCLGYATTPDETGYAGARLRFLRGALLTASTPEGRFIYVACDRAGLGVYRFAAYRRFPERSR